MVFTAEPAVAGALAQQFEGMWTDTARFCDYRPGTPAQRSPAVQAQPKGQPEPSGGGDTVYITRTGKKYHRGGCSSLSRSKIPISRSEAEARGYTPCSRCSP